MASRQYLRKAASLAAVVILFVWAQTDAAVASSVGLASDCHARMLQMHHGLRAGAHGMPAGCCPKHKASEPAFAPQPSGCCFASEQPVRPRAFLVPSGFAVELGSQASERNFALSLSPLGLTLAESPPFTKPVFSKKADLRI
jgi:hypothetical protein